jgi:O-antigen/teichoic acid export membrane protein
LQLWIVFGAFFILAAIGVSRLLGPDWEPSSTSVRLSARLTEEDYNQVRSKNDLKRERLKSLALMICLIVASLLMLWLLGEFD